MHFTLEQPRSGEIVFLSRGDTLELFLRQRGAPHRWLVAMAPYGMDLLEDSAGPTGSGATRRLMFRAMTGAGGILRLERGSAEDDAAQERLDLLVTVARN
jgi:hypothetical protein